MGIIRTVLCLAVCAAMLLSLCSCGGPGDVDLRFYGTEKPLSEKELLELPGEVLVKKLEGLSGYFIKLWYDRGGDPKLPEDWYSLLAQSPAQEAGGRSYAVSVLCIFDEGKVPDRGFRPFGLEYEETVTVSGTAVGLGNGSAEFRYGGVLYHVETDGGTAALREICSRLLGAQAP